MKPRKYFSRAKLILWGETVLLALYSVLIPQHSACRGEAFSEDGSSSHSFNLSPPNFPTSLPLLSPQHSVLFFIPSRTAGPLLK